MTTDRPETALLSRLTTRQREVARRLAQGLNEAEVAALLSLSEHTIHEHVRHIYERLGCHRRGKLIELVLRSDISS